MGVAIDKAVAELVQKRVKNPYTEYKSEWDSAKTKEVTDHDAAKKAQAEADANAEAKASFEKQKAGPHGISFSQFESGTVAGLGPDAIKAFKATQALKPEGIFLSNIKDNTPVSDKLMSFNVKAGPDGNQKAYTINFVKQGDVTVMKIAPGWNNINSFSDLSTTKDKQPDPVGYLLQKVGAWPGPKGPALE